jgi:hypothetical protein
MDKEQALLVLKHMIVAYIDGYWGAGDSHLTMLEMVCALDHEDQMLQALYERLKARSERCSAKEGYTAEMKAESVYRDEGKEEADKYEAEIVQRYGKEFFDRFWDAARNWF